MTLFSNVRFKDYKNHMFRHILFKASEGRHVRIQEDIVFMHLYVCVCVCEREIKIVGAAINCDNLEIAVTMNRVEYKKKKLPSISSPRPLNICVLFIKTCVS
jgi:hypothetical protein